MSRSRPPADLDPLSATLKADATVPGAGAPRMPTEAARRALAEAEARRGAAPAGSAPKETGGRDGPDPARYGDWEKNGIVSDF